MAISEVDMAFTESPFTESPKRASTPTEATAFIASAETLWDWILAKFDVTATTNSFMKFIEKLNIFKDEVNATADAINLTANANIRTSWNTTDNFAGTIVSHNSDIWLCLVSPCTNSEPSLNNSDWVKMNPDNSAIVGEVLWFGLPISEPNMMLCDGSIISDATSPLDGTTLPNLIDRVAQGSATVGTGVLTEKFMNLYGSSYVTVNTVVETVKLIPYMRIK